jgi:hypothetical protein
VSRRAIPIDQTGRRRHQNCSYIAEVPPASIFHGADLSSKYGSTSDKFRRDAYGDESSIAIRKSFIDEVQRRAASARP